MHAPYALQYKHIDNNTWRLIMTKEYIRDAKRNGEKVKLSADEIAKIRFNEYKKMSNK